MDCHTLIYIEIILKFHGLPHRYYGMTAPFANYSVAGWLWYRPP